MKYLFLFLLYLLTWCCYSQEKEEEVVTFFPKKQFYLKGHSALIGNNIVSTHKTKAFNDASKFNDTQKLKYVDIDDDASTFSSSQATLSIPEHSKVKYAALYWSAIYPYNNGKTKVITRTTDKQYAYKGDDERDLDFNSILLKTPNSSYIPINGSIIFDGFETKVIDNAKPYVCYADVTSILQNTKNSNGNYTVANIKAAQGFAQGGCAGGWLLYIIYENETETPKYFTTYNGYLDVFKDPITINFQNFKAPETGEIKASLILGALEGDQKFKTDNCAFLDSENKNYIPLYNKVRPKLNFFNSTISIDETPFLNRLPASRNTLGFDLLKIQIPNSNNTIISNNAYQTSVQFKTKADRFYLFFMAFETEISRIYLEEKENETPILVLNKNIKPKFNGALEETKKPQEKEDTLKIAVSTSPTNLLATREVELKKQDIIKAKLVEQKSLKPIAQKEIDTLELDGVLVTTAKDREAHAMKSLTKLTEDSNIEQQNLLIKLKDKIASKQQDLNDLKEENDLSDQGIVSAPKAFKSVSSENAELIALQSDIDDVIESQNIKISELEQLYEERLKIVKNKNDSTNVFYLRKIKKLKTEQFKTIQSKENLLNTLKEIKDATEFERNRRIKRAVYDNQEARYLKDRATLNQIKQSTQVSSEILTKDDFDFGEDLNNNIRIIKNIKNIESGYYLVLAVHSNIEKRDAFLRKAVMAGQSEIDFFFDINTNNYYIYSKKFNDINSANSAMQSIGNEPYNSNLSMVKIEN